MEILGKHMKVRVQNPPLQGKRNFSLYSIYLFFTAHTLNPEKP